MLEYCAFNQQVLIQVLEPAIAQMVSADPSVAPKISRVVDVWLQRAAFPAQFIADVRKILVSPGRSKKQPQDGRRSLLASTSAGPLLGALDQLSRPSISEGPASGDELSAVLPSGAWRDAPCTPAEETSAAAAPMDDLMEHASLRSRIAGRLSSISTNAVPEWTYATSDPACPLPHSAAAPVAAKAEALARLAHVLAVENASSRQLLLGSLSEALDGVMGALDAIAGQSEQIEAALKTIQEHKSAGPQDTWVDVHEAQAGGAPPAAPSTGGGATAAAAVTSQLQAAHRQQEAEEEASRAQPVLIMMGTDEGDTEAQSNRTKAVTSAPPPAPSSPPTPAKQAPAANADNKSSKRAEDTGNADADEEDGWMHSLGIDGDADEGGEGGAPDPKKARVAGGDSDSGEEGVGSGDEHTNAGTHFTIRGRTVVYNPNPSGMVFNPITRQMQAESSLMLDEAWRD